MGTGGPHQYTGRTMPDSHAYMHISEDDFEKANDDTVLVMQEHNIGQAEQEEVLAILNSMKGDIIGNGLQGKSNPL